MDVSHPELCAGDDCPACRRGTLYDHPPNVFVRFTGQAPLQATVYRLQRFRCNLCGKVFTAPAPEDMGARKYDHTAASMIGLLKYGSGMPFNRQQRLQRNCEIPLAASTQWEIVSAAASSLAPAYEEHIRQAAQGEVVYNDDTTVKILELMGKRARKSPPPDDPHDPNRTGLFTSGVVATRAGRRIALFFSGRQHAGENLSDVLQHRAAELDAPTHMCDGLSRNLPKELATILANVFQLAHELVSRLPETRYLQSARPSHKPHHVIHFVGTHCRHIDNQANVFDIDDEVMAMRSQEFELVGGMITDPSIGRMEFYLDNGDGVLTRPADQESDGTASVATTGGTEADELLYTAHNGESASYTLHAGQLPAGSAVTLIAASHDPQGNLVSETSKELTLTRNRLMVGVDDASYSESVGHWEPLGEGYRRTTAPGAWGRYRFDNLPWGSYNVYENHSRNSADLASIRVYDGDPKGRETQTLTFQTELSEVVMQEDGLAVEFDGRMYWDIGTVSVSSGTLVVELTANCDDDGGTIILDPVHPTPPPSSLPDNPPDEACFECGLPSEIPGLSSTYGEVCIQLPSAPSPDPTSGNTIMYTDGGAVMSVDDLAGSGGCATGGCGGSSSLMGGHKRMFSNQFNGRSDYGNGYGWEVRQWPYLIEDDAQSGDYTVSTNGIIGAFFGKDSGGDYVSAHGSLYGFEHTNNLFILTGPEGMIYEFHDFTQTTYPQGAMKRAVTPGNHVIEVQSYDNDGQMTEIRESFTEYSTTTINSWAYTYLSSEARIQEEACLHSPSVSGGVPGGPEDLATPHVVGTGRDPRSGHHIPASTPTEDRTASHSADQDLGPTTATALGSRNGSKNDRLG